MAIVSRFGKPDLFLTMTMDASCDEVKRNIFPLQQPSDRPDIVVRVFRSKLMHLEEDIVTRRIFGEVRNYMYRIEFQKRSLPHVHMLTTLGDKDKLKTPEDVDSVIRATVPDASDTALFDVVTKCNLHTRCDLYRPPAGVTYETDPNRPSCLKKVGDAWQCSSTIQWLFEPQLYSRPDPSHCTEDLMMTGLCVSMERSIQMQMWCPTTLYSLFAIAATLTWSIATLLQV